MPCLITVRKPSDQRLVIVQDLVDGEVKTVGARFENNKWIGEESKLPIRLSKSAIWAESFYYPES